MRRAALGAPLVAALVAASGAGRPEPLAAPIVPGGIVVEDAACARCHAAEAREWRGSQHRGAFVDPMFQRALAAEPQAFCVDCHGPVRAAREHGIGCVACHGERAHAAPAVACASCHEFAFPSGARSGRRELMQSTASEHARFSAARAKGSAASCAGCHMPTAAADGHRSHAFVGGGDQALVRSSLVVNATRTSSTRVHIVLSPATVGHCVPTGDLFRRLEVSAEALGGDLEVVADARAHLARRFRIVRDGAAVRKELAADDRVGDAPRAVDLDLGPLARGRAIAWRVAYQRVESPGGDTDAAVVAGEIEISAGVAPPPLLQPPVE
ncbi:MAG: hypothetical protein ABJE95_31195 [Byssovorax sp.]